MVPKELLGNEEEGKGIPFLGSQKKGNQQKGTSNLEPEQLSTSLSDANDLQPRCFAVDKCGTSGGSQKDWTGRISRMHITA